MIRLKKAKDSLIEFTKLLMPDPADPDDLDKSRYDVQKHHEYIAAALEAVERGEIPRLIITMPPRAGKSELAAKKFLPWCSGRDPYKDFIFATYSADFAEDTGRKVRDALKSKSFQQIFPGCKLKKGSSASDRLETEEGGILAFVGAGGAITGRGAHGLVIDDPIKDREQADSTSFRNKQWEWFNQVAMSRLADSAAWVLIIMTRWHEDDIVGRLTDPKNDAYSEDEASKWKILELPALAREDDPMGRAVGESIWPANKDGSPKFPSSYFISVRNRDPRGFSALYQGRPTPEEGVFFKANTFIGYQRSEMPTSLRWYGASDHAVSEAQRADSSVLGCGGVDEKGVLWIPPTISWGRFPSDIAVEKFAEQIRLHRPLLWWAEKGHISKSIGPFLHKYLIEQQLYCSIYEMTPAKDKRTRAQSIHGRISMGMVRFPFFADWWPDAKDQLLKFPNATHDDFVDWIAWLGIGLGSQVNAPVAKKSNDKEPKPGTLPWIKATTKWDRQEAAALTKNGF
jgi:predicted phage terminase large subunit-like protein